MIIRKAKRHGAKMIIARLGNTEIAAPSDVLKMYKITHTQFIEQYLKKELK